MGKLKNLFKKWWSKASDEDKQHYYDELEHFNEDLKKIWLCVNKSGQEVMILNTNIPHRMLEGWWTPDDEDSIVNYDIMYLDDGYIEEHLGKKLTWGDEPVEFTPLICKA